MKTVPICLLPFVFFAACSTVERSRMPEDQTFSSYPIEDLTSLQFAEPIDSRRFRIHNIFQRDSGEIVNLGSYIITVGEVAFARGRDDMPVKWSPKPGQVA